MHTSYGHDEHEFECDAPGCTAAFCGEGAFADVWNEAKDEGWRCFKDRVFDEFFHVCPSHLTWTPESERS